MNQQQQNEDFSAIATEQRNEETVNIDCLSALEIVNAINRQDAGIHLAVQKEAARIAQAIDMITDSFRRGGRLFYIGAGTSGRLGVLDASECPPTFGVDPSMVVGIIAGGDHALRSAVEGVEDDYGAGVREIAAHQIGEKDTIVGITASGRAPYVIGALTAAGAAGCQTVGLCSSADSRLAQVSGVCITVEVGPEVILGSTRMKSGTAQKMVLNMLSTGAMIQTGKVYGNLMVDMQPKNTKLVDRAIRIVEMAAGCSREAAVNVLEQTDYHTKPAIVMILTGCSKEEALKKLEDHGGFVRKCLP